MKQLKRYYKNGTQYETYSVLYEDEDFMLVRNDDHDEKEFNGEYGAYSFGKKPCFYSLYFFPVNWSCLHKDEAVKELNRLIKCERKYIPKLGEIVKKSIARWQDMITALEMETA